MNARHRTMVLGLLVTAALLTPAQAAPALPSGTFTGTGHWRGAQGAAGDYSVETTILNDTLTSLYRFSAPNPRQEKVTMTLARKGEPFFDVLDEKGAVVGQGYCFDDECFYRAEFGGIVVQETLRPAAGGLEKVGSKKGPNFTVVWKEVLASR